MAKPPRQVSRPPLSRESILAHLAAHPGDTKRDLEFELTDELATFITDLHASEINGEITMVNPGNNRAGNW